MNFLVLSKIYSLIDEECECENCKLEQVKLKNYEELEQKLLEFNYDYTPGEILIDVKYDSNIEEALAKDGSLILTSDDTKIEYSDVQFLIKWFCGGKAVIAVKDDKKYCQECFEQSNKQQSYAIIKKILESKDEMYGLSTSQKIEYILVKNKGKKLSAAEIYDIGAPWDLKTFTPRNSVYARASSLQKEGTIQRDGVMYYV
jgi:hypothetical protein